jgi:hypothetical protein
VVESVSLSSTSYASVGVQPAADAQPSLPVAPPQPVSSAAAATGQTASPPGFVPDFTNGTIVLDWKDPVSDQVLVQVPMRTALANFAGSEAAPAQVGKLVNTEV